MASSLLVLGNLLLDMVVPVEDSFLDNFSLSPDSIQIATGAHFKIYTEILKRENVVLSPGGSALNTVRMAQKILNIPNAITLVGAVGRDEAGKILVETVEKEGIKMAVQIVDNESTGRCASLLTKGGSARTMVTDLGAALRFSHETWVETTQKYEDKAGEKVKKFSFVYITSYFLKVSSATVMQVTEQAKQRNIPILLNLNAVWVTTSYQQELRQLLPLVDVLFGNEAEIKSFANELRVLSTQSSTSENCIGEIALALSTWIMDKKLHSSSPRNTLIIVTRGELPVICVKNGQLQEYPVHLVPKDKLMDTTGAGDAFVGGFLASYVQKKSFDECMSCAIWAATEELKGFGFVLPAQIPEKFQTVKQNLQH